MPSAVYFLRPVGQSGPTKIGCSILPELRLRRLTEWSPVPLELVARIPGDFVLEQRLHARFEHLHLRHEWFSEDPELSATIASIIQGGFDFDQLPPPKVLTFKLGRRRDPWSPERKHVAWLARRVIALRAQGITVPEDVRKASRRLSGDDAEARNRNQRLVEAYLQDVHGLSLSRAAA